MDTVVDRNRSLANLLSLASPNELAGFADVLTDGGKGRVSISSDFVKRVENHKTSGNLRSMAEELAAEFLLFGGNSFANKWRDKPLDYREVLSDVAQKIGHKPTTGDDLFALEQAVVKAEQKKAPSETADSSLLSTETLSNVGKKIAASGSSLAGYAFSGSVSGAIKFVGTRAVSAIALPVAIGTTAVYVANEAAGPAFRVTKPAVLKIAAIRRRLIDQDISAMRRELEKCL